MMSQIQVLKNRRQEGENGKATTALLLIDVINPMDFDGGEDLLNHGWPVAQQIAAIKQRFYDADLPVIYVNDNFGYWRSDFREQVSYCLQKDKPGYRIVELLKPGQDDYFVLKPKHSAFYCTPLELLLKHLNIDRLILTGYAGNLCVLYTAYDAYMRDYQLHVPSDCIASESATVNQQVLDQMQRDLKADVTLSQDISLPCLQSSPDKS